MHIQNIKTTPETSEHYIQGDKKVSVRLMIAIQKVASNVQSVPASLQIFTDMPNCVLVEGGH
jgi:hypothetical protein